MKIHVKCVLRSNRAVTFWEQLWPWASRKTKEKKEKKNHLIFFREREKKKIPQGEEIFPDEETVGDKAESVFRNGNLYQYFLKCLSMNAR